MGFQSLPVEFDEAGLVPIAVTRERQRAYLRACYPMLYRIEAEGRRPPRSGFAAGFIAEPRWLSASPGLPSCAFGRDAILCRCPHQTSPTTTSP